MRSSVAVRSSACPAAADEASTSTAGSSPAQTGHWTTPPRKPGPTANSGKASPGSTGASTPPRPGTGSRTPRPHAPAATCRDDRHRTGRDAPPRQPAAYGSPPQVAAVSELARQRVPGRSRTRRSGPHPWRGGRRRRWRCRRGRPCSAACRAPWWGLGNALSEVTNIHLRLLSRRAYWATTAPAQSSPWLPSLAEGSAHPPQPITKTDPRKEQEVPTLATISSRSPRVARPTVLVSRGRGGGSSVDLAEGVRATEGIDEQQ